MIVEDRKWFTGDAFFLGIGDGQCGPVGRRSGSRTDRDRGPGWNSRPLTPVNEPIAFPPSERAHEFWDSPGPRPLVRTQRPLQSEPNVSTRPLQSEPNALSNPNPRSRDPALRRADQIRPIRQDRRSYYRDPSDRLTHNFPDGDRISRPHGLQLSPLGPAKPVGLALGHPGKPPEWVDFRPKHGRNSPRSAENLVKNELCEAKKTGPGRPGASEGSDQLFPEPTFLPFNGDNPDS